jgi:ACS family tartrate transporter-like MFS transporter
MNGDLNFSPAVYGFGAGLFFVGTALFQVPANLILNRIGARRWVFLILATWGLLSSACALVRGPASFYALRFMLGIAECGFFPGMLFYLTLWFPQTYRTRFTAGFMAAIPVSFILGAPLSGLILGMDGIAGLHGWQWLFLLEGLPAFLLAFAVLKYLPDGPRDASWLSRDEEETIVARLSAEDSEKPAELWSALLDPRVLALGVVSFAIQSGFYGVTLWLPQIVQGMGFSNVATGFVVAMPFIASMVAMLLWGYSSDIRNERIWHVALPALLTSSGLAAASLAQTNLQILSALSLATIGLMAGLAPMFSLPSSFLRGAGAAGGIAICTTLGILGGFAGPYVVGALKQTSGNYTPAMAALAIALALAAGIVLILGRAAAPRVVLGTTPNVS